MTTTDLAERRSRGRRRMKRVPPPPFRAQRAPTRWLLLALLAALVATVAVGALAPVPTFARARYAVVDSGPPGGRSVLLVLLDPRFDGAVPPGTEVRLQVGGGSAEVPGVTDRSLGRLSTDELVRMGMSEVALAGLGGDHAMVRAGAASDAAVLPDGATGEATVRMGERPLGAVFLGRGLEVAP